MKNKGIVIFLAGITIVIIMIIVAEFRSARPDRQQANPYALDTDTLYSVDQELITYREFRQLKLNFTDMPTGISGIDGRLTIVGDMKLVTINSEGKLLVEKTLNVKPLCVKSTRNRIYVGSEKKVTVFDISGSFISEFDGLYENSIVTSIDTVDNKIMVADAGKRLVYRYNNEGTKEIEFEGKVAGDSGHIFVVPSPSFDLAVNHLGELWVVNPGKHALENYTIDGKLQGWWESSATDISGFSGCCNPAHLAFLPDGNFVTSEKRIVRIKEYKPSGELAGVIAAPSAFEGEVYAPDLYCDETGRVFALDSEKKMIRIFDKIKK